MLLRVSAGHESGAVLASQLGCAAAAATLNSPVSPEAELECGLCVCRLAGTERTQLLVVSACETPERGAVSGTCEVASEARVLNPETLKPLGVLRLSLAPGERLVGDGEQLCAVGCDAEGCVRVAPLAVTLVEAQAELSNVFSAPSQRVFSAARGEVRWSAPQLVTAEKTQASSLRLDTNAAISRDSPALITREL